MSDPRPWEVSTGMRARMVVADVMNMGLIRSCPALMMAGSISVPLRRC